MRSPVVLLGLLTLSCPALGQSTLTAGQIPRSSVADASAVEFRNLKVSGSDLHSAVGKVVKGLDWKSTLMSARREAVKTGKPIVWIQALGDLRGYT